VRIRHDKRLGRRQPEATDDAIDPYATTQERVEQEKKSAIRLTPVHSATREILVSGVWLRGSGRPQVNMAVIERSEPADIRHLAKWKSEGDDVPGTFRRG
jgi:hypothetical protein